MTGAFGHRLEPLEPGQELVVHKMYYTLCPACGALNDWSETLAEARRRRREHFENHEKRAYIHHPR